MQKRNVCHMVILKVNVSWFSVKFNAIYINWTGFEKFGTNLDTPNPGTMLTWVLGKNEKGTFDFPTRSSP